MTATATNLVPLDVALKAKFQDLFRGIKRNTIALAKEAFEIHSQHYLEAEKKYDPSFVKWWQTNGMDQVFGGRSNWTKWHSAGKAIATVEAQFEQHIDKLPVSRDALYEIARLSPEEMGLCLESKYTRKSVTEPQKEWHRPRKPAPVINPAATAASNSELAETLARTASAQH